MTISVAPAKAGAHNHRPFVIAKVVCALRSKDRFRGLGPGLRRDDPGRYSVDGHANFNPAFTKLKRPRA